MKFDWKSTWKSTIIKYQSENGGFHSIDPQRRFANLRNVHAKARKQLFNNKKKSVTNSVSIARHFHRSLIDLIGVKGEHPRQGKRSSWAEKKTQKILIRPRLCYRTHFFFFFSERRTTATLSPSISDNFLVLCDRNFVIHDRVLSSTTGCLHWLRVKSMLLPSS